MSTSTDLLYNQIKSLPEDIKKEALDFIAFLLIKKLKIMDQKQNSAKFGSSKGNYTIQPDFYEPLDDFEEYMK